jgi:hypothetical protein
MTRRPEISAFQALDTAESALIQISSNDWTAPPCDSRIYFFAPNMFLYRKKITTLLIELAAVMATDKVSRKAAKA